MATRMTLYGLGEVSDGDLFVLDVEALQRGVIERSLHGDLFADTCKMRGVEEYSTIMLSWTSAVIAQDQYYLFKLGDNKPFWSGDADCIDSVLHNFLKRKGDLSRKPKQKIRRTW